MDTNKIIQDQIDTYLNNFLMNKDDSLGTFQNDRVTQHMRFKHVIEPFKEVLNEKITFHDFGCGCCDMYEYIKLNNIKLSYSGTEIIQEMIRKLNLLSYNKRELIQKTWNGDIDDIDDIDSDEEFMKIILRESDNDVDSSDSESNTNCNKLKSSKIINK
jgi:hypothetical protein